jgi:DNA-binding transcriptional ArsR family regulator
VVDTRYSLAPQVVTVSFGVEPVQNALESFSLLTQVDALSGLGDWVVTTAAALPPERLRFHDMLFDVLGYLFVEIEPPTPQQRDFPSYVSRLASLDAEATVETLVEAMRSAPLHHPEAGIALEDVPPAESLLRDRDLFVQYLSKAKSCQNTEAMERAHHLLNDPPAMLAEIDEHFTWMWHETFASEWARVKPMIEESVAAFERLEFYNLTALEAIRAVTGRDMTGKMGYKLENTERLRFVPNAHIGPYISKWKQNETLLLSFGARLPRGVHLHSSALSRSELLVRLNALADDTRLRILELLTQHEELCAQDIIERLGLSQSTISRHLSQLSASGYITERRREVAKCYSLNTDRVVDTVRSLTNFLSRQ